MTCNTHTHTHTLRVKARSIVYLFLPKYVCMSVFVCVYVRKRGKKLKKERE